METALPGILATLGKTHEQGMYELDIRGTTKLFAIQWLRRIHRGFIEFRVECEETKRGG